MNSRRGAVSCAACVKPDAVMVAYDYAFKTHWGGVHADDRRTFNGELEVFRVRLDRGGYDRNGQYFGQGAPLWNLVGDVGATAPRGVDFYVRARDATAMKALVRRGYPRATFSKVRTA